MERIDWMKKYIGGGDCVGFEDREKGLDYSWGKLIGVYIRYSRLDYYYIVLIIFLF